MVYLRKRRREKQQHSCSQKMLFLFPCLVIHHVTTQIYLVTPWESQPKGVEAVTKTLKRVKIYIYIGNKIYQQHWEVSLTRHC